MTGKRKRPKLRFNGTYFVANYYKPNGKRSMISFGTMEERTESDIRIAFETWLELYEKQPHKVLSFVDPYQAIEQIINPITISTVQDLLEKYEINLKKIKKNVRHDLEHPDLRFVKRVKKYLEPYNNWLVDSFGPDELENVKQSLINSEYVHGKVTKKYTRRGINDTIKWIRNIWKWGLGRRLVKYETVQGLEEIKSLKMGASTAKDNFKRKSVTEEEFIKVVNSVNSVVGDMLQLIWYTGMRPYEVCEMRPYDIIRDDPECWLYIPGRDKTPVGQHKTTRYEKVKVIPLTGKPQNILSSRIKDYNSKDYIFSPKIAMQEIYDEKSKDRKTPLKFGNRPGTNRKKSPMIKPGNHYVNDSLCKACKRGCKIAGVEDFVPYDLRRTVATKTRAILGKEAAKTLLGHADTATTDIYLLDEVKEAVKVAKRRLSRMSLKDD